ncbi:hypothetical protein V6N13_013853 [Hibiscus sabdariffa]|uniref:Uncharacterized protein n=2 Tax=Hibiscus sabdariffa TaxID=183260 RepID=A0ABR1ZNE6_9ROSI
MKWRRLPPPPFEWAPLPPSKTSTTGVVHLSSSEYQPEPIRFIARTKNSSARVIRVLHTNIKWTLSLSKLTQPQDKSKEIRFSRRNIPFSQGSE